MPQHVQPNSLRVMAVEQVAKMAFHAFVAIEAKHELCEWSAALQKEVANLQEFFLSSIQHLWDDVCQVICDMYVLKSSKDRRKQFKLDKCRHSLRDIRVLALFMIHDQMRKLTLCRVLCSQFRGKLCLSECQISKLTSIEKLDFQYNQYIKITDKVLKMIGDICKDLKEIRISLHSSDVTLESLNNLLNCKELQYVFISTGRNKEFEPFMLKLLTDLPKLKKIVVDLNILPKLTSFTSIEHLRVKVDNANELKEMIKFCPNIHHLYLNIDSKTHVERQEVQTLFAECTFQLLTLKIIRFTFDQSMVHLLQLKGRNLTRLVLEKVEGADITLDNIHVIGINCPKLEELRILEPTSDDDIDKYKDASFRSPVLPPETLIVTTPHMFCNLENLQLRINKGWDIRILLQILLHANNLKRIQVTDLFFHGSCDILAEILSGNPLINLERVIFEMLHSTGVFSRISRSSLMQLIDSCPKLNYLDLELTLEHDAILYMRDLETKVYNENLDLEIDFVDPSDSDLDSDESEDDEDVDHLEDSEGMDDLEFAEDIDK